MIRSLASSLCYMIGPLPLKFRRSGRFCAAREAAVLCRSARVLSPRAKIFASSPLSEIPEVVFCSEERDRDRRLRRLSSGRNWHWTFYDRAPIGYWPHSSARKALARAKASARKSLNGPLSGRRILITRARTQAVALQQGIEDLGGEAVLLPTIEIQPPSSYGALDR